MAEYSNKTTTKERLQYLINEFSLRQVDIINKCKPFCEKYGIRLEKNDLSQYVSGKTIPSQEKLTVLANALGVTEPWLMGYDVPMYNNNSSLNGTFTNNNIFQGNNIEQNNISNAKELSDQQKELLNIFDSLDVRGQSELILSAYEIRDKYKQ